ncbi:hypothetical protein [Oryzibacter oryziterrae]|uniref:hypothetical protein n=1 Tax=Oryzibacter oryziterrae TaxID=2766474 RepID=UPI001F3874CE|nr:hypothetical protein [Oryzibacter oryziterrae]
MSDIDAAASGRAEHRGQSLDAQTQTASGPDLNAGSYHVTGDSDTENPPCPVAG